MNKVNVTYGFGFNQFSFGDYDGMPVVDGRLVTPVMFIVDMPMYDYQMNLISKALDKELNSLSINFKLSVEFVYNNYGNLFIVWSCDKRNFGKCMKLSENLNNNEFNTGDIEMLSLYFFDFENWLENDYESDLENIELYIGRCKFLGYLGDLNNNSDIAEHTGLDIDFVNNYMNSLLV